MDITNIMYTFGSYEISYLEFCVVLLNLATVVAFRKNTKWAYLLSLMTCAGLTIMLFQINLYSEMILNMYYVCSAIVGLVMWSGKSGKELRIRYLTNEKRLLVLALVTSLTLVLGLTIDDVFSYLGSMVSSDYVHVPDASPFIDAFVTIMSFMAMYLMINRYIDSWVLWSVVNLANIWLYNYRGIQFMSWEYLLLLSNSVYAWYQWDKMEIRAFQVVRSNIENYVGSIWIRKRDECYCVAPIGLEGHISTISDINVLRKNDIEILVGVDELAQSIHCNRLELDVLSDTCNNKITISDKVTYAPFK